MKTAEEWLKEQRPANVPANVLVADIEVIEAIQLDAAKWGMEQAAKVIHEQQGDATAILTSATNLTINDLTK
jgi:hypothetical protein